MEEVGTLFWAGSLKTGKCVLDLSVEISYLCKLVICVILLLLALFYVLFVFVLFYVLFACKRVLYHCHRMLTQLQLTNTYIVSVVRKHRIQCT